MFLADVSWGDLFEKMPAILVAIRAIQAAVIRIHDARVDVWSASSLRVIANAVRPGVIGADGESAGHAALQ